MYLVSPSMSPLGPRSLLASLLKRSCLWKPHDLESPFAGECLGAAVEHVPTRSADEVREHLAVGYLCFERLDLERGNGVLYAAGQDRARLHPVDEHANRGPDDARQGNERRDTRRLRRRADPVFWPTLPESDDNSARSLPRKFDGARSFEREPYCLQKQVVLVQGLLVQMHGLT